MKKNKTEIVIVMDRSGSMSSIAKDMEGGLKTYLEDQRKESGECFVTLYRFDDVVERVFENLEIDSVKDISLHPRGSTALYDAVGRACNEVGQRLAKTKVKDRPSLVLFVIVTDGYNNASKEFSKDQVKKVIDHQTEKYQWQFIFLGANFDAYAVGQDVGFKGGKSMSFGTDSLSINNTYLNVSKMSSKLRACSHDGLAAMDSVVFNESERAASKLS